MHIGEKIREIRISKGITQKQLAEKLNTSQQNLAQYENGKRNPKLETLQRIATALDVAISNLLTKEYIMQGNITRNDLNDWIDVLGETKSDKINELFDSLNEKGKDKAIEQVELLTKIPEYTEEES